MRVGIYYRVSTKDQGLSLQKRDLGPYAAHRGWTDIKEYEDHGFSGKHDARPGLQALLSDARNRKLDVIVIWKLDRLFRSLRHLVSTVQELEELDVKLVSYKEQVDLSSSSGRLMVHLLAAFAEFERDLIAERVSAGLKAAKASGKRIGRPRLQGVVLIKIRKLSELGYSNRQISAKLGVSLGSVNRIISEQKALAQEVS